MTRKKEAHMNFSLSFFAGILWAALLAPAVAGFPQGQSSQAALAKQSNIVFSGTVSQLGAVSFAGVPQGTQATFYTEGWIFGSGVAVKELGHDFNPGGASAAGAGRGETALGYTQEQISDQELRDRLNAADFVVIGRVTDVHRWTVPKSATPHRVSEHDPDWHEAVVEVQSVLKGGQVKGNKVVVRFPGRNDVAWVHSPKFEKNQQGIFCLNRD